MNVIRTHPCPDCGASFTSGLLKHEKTCPISVALDEAMDADRAWFDAHPNASSYFREMNIADRDDFLRTLPSQAEGCEILEVTGRIRVVSLGPGMRGRDFSNVRCVYAV